MLDDSSLELVRRFYDFGVLEEWARLEKHPLEFAVTCRALKDFLPAAPAAILDCGCGPGRYALHLAQQGYTLSLFDLSELNLTYAQMKLRAAGCTWADSTPGSATDLSHYADAVFDAVLCMGPLYHLLHAQDQRQALRECWRVLKPGGVLLTAFVSRYAGLRYMLKHDPQSLLRSSERVAAFWQTGTFAPVRADGTEFLAYFIAPQDVQPLLENAGFEVQTVLAVESFSSMIDEALNAAAPDVFAAWLEELYRAAADPSLHGGCEHLLAVGIKK
ncbi:MAG: methyltransferase domain-containing protein [Anaerolineales bacterium]